MTLYMQVLRPRHHHINPLVWHLLSFWTLGGEEERGEGVLDIWAFGESRSYSSLLVCLLLVFLASHI